MTDGVKVSNLSSSLNSKRSSKQDVKPNYTVWQGSKKEKVFHAIKQLVEAILDKTEPVNVTHQTAQVVVQDFSEKWSSFDQGNVEIGPLIGVGSFGKVYKGTWGTRTVAIKVIPDHTHGAEWLAMEIHLAMVLRHPNIVRCYTINMAPGSSSAAASTKLFNLLNTEHSVNMMRYSERTYSPHSHSMLSPCLNRQHAAGLLATDEWHITLHPLPSALLDSDTQLIMEYCDQGSLADAGIAKRFFCMDGIAPNLRAILMRAKDIASGMRYLHSWNVCHGDLKTENVLLQTDLTDDFGCTAKVADFGLCGILRGGCTHISKRLNCGTISHSAPELLQTGRLCPASDVYSFGIILWEMVTAMHPFPGMRDGEIVRRVCDGERPTFPAHIPAAYVQLTEDCWAQEPSQRPTFDDLLHRLRQLLLIADELQEACESPLRELHSWIMTF